MTRLATLAEVEAAVWQELAGCVGQRGHPWRTPVLATTDGEVADARTVVLREVDFDRRQLVAYTDLRSPKAAQIRQHPGGTLVMWSPALGWQLRCRVRIVLDTSGLAVASRWARIKLSPAAQDYLSPLAPGAELGAQPGLSAQPALPPADPAGDMRESLGHFAVMHAEVTALDWLELHPKGQRRAMFDAAGGRWLQP